MINFSSVPLNIRLPMAIVGTGLLMSILVGTIGYIQLDHLARLEVNSSITALLESRKAAVETFYTEIGRNVQDMSSSPQTIAGFRRLELGWKSAGLDPQATLTADYITNNPNLKAIKLNLSPCCSSPQLH